MYDSTSYAYTAHRILCWFLILSSIVNFCCYGRLLQLLIIIGNDENNNNSSSSTTCDPFLRLLVVTFVRPYYSFLSLIIDLLNTNLYVYPTLLRMEYIIPTLVHGSIATQIGLPKYIDFILYTLVLIFLIGGGSNIVSSLITKQSLCSGYDTVIAGSIGYCSIVHWNSLPLATTVTAITATGKIPQFLSPQTTFWGYLPITAMLGGNATYIVAWMLAGASGVMLGQYHLDNQNWILAATQFFRGKFLF